MHVCAKVCVCIFAQLCVFIPTNACMCLRMLNMKVCARVCEREPERESVGGIRFDKVPHFSEIITCSRYSDRVVSLRAAEKAKPEKNCFSLSFFLPVSLCLFLPVHPTLVLVAANEGVWLSLEALRLNYHIN